MYQAIRVGEGQPPFRRVTVDIGKLIWANHPLTAQDMVVVRIFGKQVSLRFDNGPKICPKKATFEINSPLQFDKLFSQGTEIQFRHHGELVGTSTFVPELMQSRMILPIYSNVSQRKLGDFEFRIDIFKPKTDMNVMCQISSYLADLEKNPCQFQKMLDQLHQEDYI